MEKTNVKDAASTPHHLTDAKITSIQQNKNYVVCRYCGQPAKRGGLHHCEQMRQNNVSSTMASDDDGEGDLFVSFFVAYTTDNWLLGYSAGGQMLPAIIGDLMRFTPSQTEPVQDRLSADLKANRATEIDEERQREDTRPVIVDLSNDLAASEPLPLVPVSVIQTITEPDIDTTQGDSRVAY